MGCNESGAFNLKTAVSAAFLFVFLIPLANFSCKRQKPDEILLVKNLIIRWENGVVLNSPDSLKAVFSAKKELIVKSPEEMEKFIYSGKVQNIRVAGRSIRLYREEGKVQSAQVELTLSGSEPSDDSLQAWQGKLHLLLRKHKGKWGIVDYKFE
jgi:hypothetical protein